MEQYGFICPGNPFDRLNLDDLQLPSSCRMSRDAIAAAANAAAAAVSSRGALAAAAPDGQGVQNAFTGTAQSGGAAGALGKDVQLAVWDGDAAAALQRLQCAAASLAGRLGWRSMAEYRAVSKETTAQCIAAAKRCLRRQLEAFGTTAEEDVRELRALVNTTSGNDSSSGSSSSSNTTTSSDGCCSCGSSTSVMGRSVDVDGSSNSWGLQGSTGMGSRVRFAAALRYRLEQKLLIVAGIQLLQHIAVD